MTELQFAKLSKIVCTLVIAPCQLAMSYIVLQALYPDPRKIPRELMLAALIAVFFGTIKWWAETAIDSHEQTDKKSA